MNDYTGIITVEPGKRSGQPGMRINTRLPSGISISTTGAAGLVFEMRLEMVTT